MAKLERVVKGEFNEILDELDEILLDDNVYSKLIDSSDFYGDGTRCSSRVYQRYSFFSDNRVTFSITLFDDGKEIRLSVIVIGGDSTRNRRFKNRGEDNLLKKLKKHFIL